MNQVANKFGIGKLYDAQDLAEAGLTYCIGCACTSIQAEMLSYANANPTLFTLQPEKAQNIVVLSCQVTDLAIYNDMRNMQTLMYNYPDAINYFIGGCLAHRFDIPMPHDLHNVVKRLDSIRSDYQQIDDTTLIDFAPPFWVPGFKESDNPFTDGNLFRNSYPLRIGVGCNGKCKYCSINTTRDDSYELLVPMLRDEFLSHDNIVLISDSPSVQQVKDWCTLAIEYNKSFSIRNVEPQVAVACLAELIKAAEADVLEVLHVPVQSMNIDCLRDMGSNVDATVQYVQHIDIFKEAGTSIATNVIIDYKDFPNPTKEELAVFDYVSWNPYWDGSWNIKKASDRFNKYILSGMNPIV
jgi:tRNA A37 methylthiotransferase MiaB